MQSPASTHLVPLFIGVLLALLVGVVLLIGILFLIIFIFIGILLFFLFFLFLLDADLKNGVRNYATSWGIAYARGSNCADCAPSCHATRTKGRESSRPPCACIAVANSVSTRVLSGPARRVPGLSCRVRKICCTNASFKICFRYSIHLSVHKRVLV